MDLVLTGALAKQILVMAKKDGKLAQTLAEQFLRTIDPATIADYLLSADVAVGLLADRIKKNPEATLRELQALPLGGGRPTKKVAAPRVAAKRGKRIRLTPGQIEKIKSDVRRFLQQKPWSNRKQISKAAHFPSLAAYNRIMAELRAASIIQSKGEKSKTVYALKGAKAAAVAKPVKPARKVKAKPGKKAKPVTQKPKPGKKAKPVTQKVKKAKVGKAAPKKAKPRKPAPPRLCPYPNCKNKAAPIFGMMCKEHKDVPKAERDKYFAARRAAAKS